MDVWVWWVVGIAILFLIGGAVTAAVFANGAAPPASPPGGGSGGSSATVGAPTALRLINSTPTVLQVSWSPPVSGPTPTAYAVSFSASVAGGALVQPTTVEVSGTSASVSVAPLTTYYATVASIYQSSTAPSPVSSSGGYDILLCGGQSNMVGADTSTNAGAYTTAETTTPLVDRNGNAVLFWSASPSDPYGPYPWTGRMAQQFYQSSSRSFDAQIGMLNLYQTNTPTTASPQAWTPAVPSAANPTPNGNLIITSAGAAALGGATLTSAAYGTCVPMGAPNDPWGGAQVAGATGSGGLVAPVFYPGVEWTSSQGTGGVSPSYEFAKYYAETVPAGRQLVVVPVAVASTGFGNGSWGASPPQKLYQRMVNAALAIKAVPALIPHPSGTFAGCTNHRTILMWHQGEADWPTSTGYGAALATMIAGLRTALTTAPYSEPRPVPVVLGCLCPTTNASYPVVTSTPANINAQIQQYAAGDANAVVTNANGTHEFNYSATQGETIAWTNPHFRAQDVRMMGARYFNAYCALTGLAPPADANLTALQAPAGSGVPAPQNVSWNASTGVLSFSSAATSWSALQNAGFYVISVTNGTTTVNVLASEVCNLTAGYQFLHADDSTNYASSTSVNVGTGTTYSQVLPVLVSQTAYSSGMPLAGILQVAPVNTVNLSATLSAAGISLGQCIIEIAGVSFDATKGTVSAANVPSYTGGQCTVGLYASVGGGAVAPPGTVGTITPSSSASSITFSWAAPPSGGAPSGYSVAYGSTSALGTAFTGTVTLVSGGAGGGSCTFTGLGPNVPIYVGVTATNVSIGVPQSGTQSAVQAGWTPPAAVVANNFGSTPVVGSLAYGQPTLSSLVSGNAANTVTQPIYWAPPSGGASSYVVQWSTGTPSGSTLTGTVYTETAVAGPSVYGIAGCWTATLGAATPGSLLTNVGGSAKVSFTIQAVGGGGAAGPVLLTTMAAPTALASSTIVAVRADTTIRVTWNTPNVASWPTQPHSYLVKYGVGSYSTTFMGPITLAKNGSALNSCVLGTGSEGALTQSTTYQVQITPYGCGGAATAGTLTGIATMATASVPGTVGTVTFSSLTSTGFTASWAAPSSGATPTGYTWYVSNYSDLSGPVSGSFAQTGAGTVTLSNLQPGTAYYFAVAAYASTTATAGPLSAIQGAGTTLASPYTYTTANDLSAFKGYTGLSGTTLVNAVGGGNGQTTGGAAGPGACGILLPCFMMTSGGFYTNNSTWPGSPLGYMGVGESGWTTAGGNYSSTALTAGYRDNTVQGVYFRSDDATLTPHGNEYEYVAVAQDGCTFSPTQYPGTGCLADVSVLSYPACFFAFRGSTGSANVSLGTLTAGTTYSIRVWVSARAANLPATTQPMLFFVTNLPQGLPSSGTTNRSNASPTAMVWPSAATASTIGNMALVSGTQVPPGGSGWASYVYTGAYASFPCIDAGWTSTNTPWTPVTFPYVPASTGAYYLQIGPFAYAYAGTSWLAGNVQIGH